MSIALTEEDKLFLIKAARETLFTRLTDSPRPVYHKSRNIYNEKYGLFIKTHVKDELKAYCGILNPNKNLIDTLQDIVIFGHFQDFRFQPLTRQEWEEIHIQIAVVSQVESLSDKKLIKPYDYGYAFSYNGKQVILLPWDIAQIQLDTEEYIKEACLKAGIINYQNTSVKKLNLLSISEND